MADSPIYGLGICSGAFGLELALEIAITGYRTAVLVEREIPLLGRIAARIAEGSIDPLLAWDDVGTFDGRPLRGIVSVVSAGFPCQPFSVAGKRGGTSDERWIWPDIARVIGEVEPELVFLENVSGLLLDSAGDSDRWAMEIESDDSLGGMGTVLRDLAGLGFDAEWMCLRASDIGASHGRKRVFILAYRQCQHDERRGISGILQRAARGIEGEMEKWEWGRDAAITGGDSMGKPSDWEQPRMRERPAGCEIPAGGSSLHVGEPASARHQERGDDLGLRELPAAERAGGELGDTSGGRLGVGGEPSGGDGFTDGTDPTLAHTTRDGEPGRDREAGGIGWRGIRETGGELDVSIGGRRERPDLHLRPARPDETETGARRAGAELPTFAPGPQDPIWEDVLLQRPWLRPSWSQAEAEPHIRDLVDGLASLLASERSTALRATGNGVVPLQAAAAFVLLARRITDRTRT